MLQLTLKRIVKTITYSNGKKHQLGEYQCTCGKLFEALVCNIKSGNTKSCGCMTAKLRREAVSTHGLTNHRIYNVWNTMRSRCNNPKHIQYKDYGGRGIQYCAPWDTFQNFLDDMGIPDEGMQLDRIDNNGNYCKDNCRWVTPKENLQHTRRTRYIEHNGVTKSLQELSSEFNLPSKELHKRLARGWDLDRALTQPLRPHKNRTHKKEGEEL